MRSELAVTAAASIANAMVEMGQQVGLVSNGRDAVDRIAQAGWTGDERTRAAVQSAVAMKSKSETPASSDRANDEQPGTGDSDFSLVGKNGIDRRNDVPGFVN